MQEEDKKVYRKYYSPLTLYKEDIEHIIRLFKRYCQDVEILLDSFSLSALAEVNQIPRRQLTSFSANGYLPAREKSAATEETRQHIQLELTSKMGVLTVSGGDGLFTEEVVIRINRLMVRRKDTLKLVLAFVKPLIVIIGTMLQIAHISQTSHPLLPLIIEGGIVAVLISWAIISSRLTIHRSVELYLVAINPVSKYIPDIIEIVVLIFLTIIIDYLFIYFGRL